MQSQTNKKVLLIILDGFGLRSDSDYNAIANAVMPNWKAYTEKYAFGAINASAEAVGLPKLQFGNSEVGHLNIGAGRIVQQDITKIDAAIEDGSFYTNPIFIDALNSTTSGNLHIFGLLSDGGVHSHIKHIFALIELAEANSLIKHVFLHMFLDGRDTPPRSAAKYLAELNNFLSKCHKTAVATISGRYYAMDRDKRYDRLKLAYDAIISAKSEFHGTDILRVLEDEYKADKNDEFVRPYVIGQYTGFKHGDSIIFANFRSDRAIQLSDAIVSPEFNAFERPKLELANFVSLTSYDPRFKLKIAFPPNKIINTLGEYLSVRNSPLF